MSNSPLISNKRKTQVASDGMPHGSGWNACSLPPRKPLSRLRKKVLPKLHKRLLKRPGTPPPKQFTGRSPEGRRPRQQDSQGYCLKHREEWRREQWQEEGWIRRTAGKRGSLDENRCFCILLHRMCAGDLGRSGAFGVDQDVNAPAFGGLLRFSKSDGFDPSVFQLEISYQTIADHHCACFCQQAIFLGVFPSCRNRPRPRLDQHAGRLLTLHFLSP